MYLYYAFLRYECGTTDLTSPMTIIRHKETPSVGYLQQIVNVMTLLKRFDIYFRHIVKSRHG